MKKALFAVFMVCCTVITFAKERGINTDLLSKLQNFNPASVIEGYTQTPVESSIDVDGHDAALIQRVRTFTKSNETTRFVIDQDKTRRKAKLSEHSAEMTYAEGLIEHSEDSIKPGCYKVPVPCVEEVSERFCEERTEYSSVKCGSHLEITPRHMQHPGIRRVFSKGMVPVNLSVCKGPLGQFCKEPQLIHLSPKCKRLDAVVSINGTPLPIAQMPTCENPTIILDRIFLLKARFVPSIFWADVSVTEHGMSEDNWVQSGCSEASSSSCVLDKVDACLDKNQTKLIDGIPVMRPCWGEMRDYLCPKKTSSNCKPLSDAGCTNTSSICKAYAGERCDIVSKTFQCIKKTCFPDKEVCPKTLPCIDGSCDASKSQESDDINEGVSRLGTLSGVAEEVANNHVMSDEAGIFKGEYQDCESYPLGMRDCCADKGFLDGLIHCPPKMQALIRAKLEGRVFKFDPYRHALGKKRFGFCVFPTRLAGIIQLQGRHQQLGISFGTPKDPNCRGITPKELERINFKTLDLGEMVDELLAKKVLPDTAALGASNINHATNLYQKGEGHD